MSSSSRLLHLRQRRRFLLSRLLRPVNLLPHGGTQAGQRPVRKEESLSKGQRLLVDQGVIRPLENCPGVFHYLPLAVR